MDHPFFNSSSFPWTRGDAKALHDVLLEVITMPPEIIGIYQRSGGDVNVLNVAQPTAFLWSDVLNLLANARRIREFCQELTKVQRLASNDHFQTVVQAVVDAVPGSEVRMTEEGVPVLDREDLRGKLAQLGPDASPLRVLVVRGGAKSGKTHGRHLFHMAARDHGAEKVYLCDGMVVTVKEVVNSLFMALGALEEIPDQGATTGPAWYRMVCMKLGELAIRQKRRLWIAIDDLGDAPGTNVPLLDPEIRVFCNLFVATMANPAFGERFRLMLIQYPEGPTPTEWQHEVWAEDRPTENDIVRDHVIEFLDLWTRGHGTQLFGHDLEQLADEVIAQADAIPAPGEAANPRLRRLHDALADRMRALENPAP